MPGAVKWGNEFLVNTTTTFGQSFPSVVGLSNGLTLRSTTDSDTIDGGAGDDFIDSGWGNERRQRDDRRSRYPRNLPKL
jgi:hypothetical protein